MTIVKKGQSKINKCDIQLEDWSKNYPGLYEPGAYLAAYPKAAKTIWHADKGRNIFKAGVEFRMDLPFETAKEAEEAFTALEAGGSPSPTSSRSARACSAAKRSRKRKSFCPAHSASQTNTPKNGRALSSPPSH